MNNDIKKANIAVCATVKNEAPYLLEWIAYHRVIGVDHFLIYNNDSTDRTTEILNSLAEAGILTHKKWESKAGINNQLTIYREALHWLQANCEYVVFLDADEFIVPNQHEDLKSFLLDYNNVSAIAINWKVFGSSGQKEKTNKLVIERFTKCANIERSQNFSFKTIAQVKLIQDFKNVHQVILNPNSIYVYPDRTPVSLPGVARKLNSDHSVIQINHYFTKSKAEWDLKRGRGRATINKNSLKKIRPESIFYGHDFNDEEDSKILRFLDKTKEEIKDLLKMTKIESERKSSIFEDEKIEISNITSISKYSPDKILGSGLGLPKVEEEVNPASLKVQGWVLGNNLKAIAIQVISDGRVLQEIPVAQRRPKVSAMYPDRDDSQSCGYSGSISLIGLPTQSEVLLQAILEDKSCTPIVLIQYRTISDFYRDKDMPLDRETKAHKLYKKPLMAENAINFLNSLLEQKPSLKVLEFGSGASTVWLSKFTSNLVSIEHHPDWYDKVQSTLAEDSTCQSVDLRLIPLPYYSVCDDFSDEYFDLVIVDGRDRIKCLEAAIRILKPGGVLMLDDAQRERYEKADYLLRDWEFTRSISPGRQTHWWHKPLNVGSILSKWKDILQNPPVRLYTGNLTHHAQQDGWIGISKVKSDESHILHNWRKLLPIPDRSVDAFLCEEFLKFIPPHQLLSVVFPELYRTLKAGGYIRMALSDYRCDVYLNRSLKDEKGYPYCDPEGGGKWDAEQQKITQGGLAWFPTYETLKALIELSPLRSCRADWLHYYDANGEPVMNEIDYSKGFIKRTPDNDNRVKNPRRPMSIVVDLYKD
ncbi:MAG: glycosyltransferase family 92 protein [Geitlerinemataceae cyanobacterium]